MDIKKMSFIKKVIILTIIFVLIEVTYALTANNFEWLKEIYNNMAATTIVTNVSCINISVKNENQKYCSNVEEDIYTKIINEKNSKYKVETIIDEKGNVLNKTYKDIDENGFEKGSLTYIFDNGHHLLSEISKGSFGNYRNESYYNIPYWDRLILIKYKNNEEVPYSVLNFKYKHETTDKKEWGPLYE